MPNVPERFYPIATFYMVAFIFIIMLTYFLAGLAGVPQ